MKLSIIMTLVLLGCGTDHKEPDQTVAAPTAPPAETVVTPVPTPAPVETDYFAIVETATRALVKGRTMAAIDAKALGQLSLSEDTIGGSKAYYKGDNRITLFICKGTQTIQAYTIKAEPKVLLYTQCADLLGELAPALQLGDTWAQRLNSEQLAYAEAIKTVDTDHINGNPAKYYQVIVSRDSHLPTGYIYLFQICENGKIFSKYDDTISLRDTTICN